MEQYYQSKIEHHQKQLLAASESNKVEAMKHHQEELSNYKELLSVYQQRMGTA